MERPLPCVALGAEVDGGIREILRLRHERGLSQQTIAQGCAEPRALVWASDQRKALAAAL